MAVDESAPLDEVAQQIAETVGRALVDRDRAARRLGIELQAIRPGYARLAMAVRDDMADGHGGCHRGVIATLADTAFDYAASAANQATTALAANVSYVAPARIGDRLTAEARERNRRGRIGIYDVTVRNQDRELVALLRGHACRLDGEVVAGITVAT